MNVNRGYNPFQDRPVLLVTWRVLELGGLRINSQPQRPLSTGSIGYNEEDPDAVPNLPSISLGA